MVLVALLVVAGSVGVVGWRASHRSSGPPWKRVGVRDVGLSPDRRTVYAAAEDDLHCGEVRVRVVRSARRWTVALEGRDGGGFCQTYACILRDVRATPNRPPDRTGARDSGCGPYALRLPQDIPAGVALVSG